MRSEASLLFLPHVDNKDAQIIKKKFLNDRLKIYHKSGFVGRQRGKNKIIGPNHCLIQTDGEGSPEISSSAAGRGSGLYITACA